MTNELRFQLALRPNPYIGRGSTEDEAWGTLSIELLMQGHAPPFDRTRQVTLWESEWDLAALAEWFVQHRNYLCTTTLPAHDQYPTQLPGECLAQALQRLTARDFADGEEDAGDGWADALYEFRTHHSLRLALRGARMPAIIIGCNNGSGEISLARQARLFNVDDDWTYLGMWAYPFDMERFLADLSAKLKSLLTEWERVGQQSSIQMRADRLLRAL